MFQLLPSAEATAPWRRDATCRRLIVDDQQPVKLTQAEVYQLFYPTRHSNSATSLAAKTICTRFCPVAAQCAEHALQTNDKFGIRGGLTADDRRTIRRERGLTETGVDVDDYLFDEAG